MIIQLIVLLSFSTVANTDDYYYDLDEVNKNLDTDIIEFFVTIFWKNIIKGCCSDPGSDTTNCITRFGITNFNSSR